jgi:hypothetical protein
MDARFENVVKSDEPEKGALTVDVSQSERKGVQTSNQAIKRMSLL